jgi:hypothetical protein
MDETFAKWLGLGCCDEHDSHCIVAPKDDKGRPIVPVPRETRCMCGKLSYGEILDVEEREYRENVEIASHDARWGSRHLSN